MIVAAASNGRCVDRAFSTIRAVLEYDTPLPDGWDNDTENRTPSNMIERSAIAFPGRETLVWCQKSVWEEKQRPPNITYMGEWLNPDEKWNDYLFAFSYGEIDGKYGHMVCGWPTTYGNMQVSFAIAVKMDGD